MTFSVITVCYNCKDSIDETVQSVLNQKYSDYEYLIIDGASSDGTTEIIKKYALENERIRVISEPDKGIYDAMNKGVRNSKGKYVYFLNSGDTFYDNNVLRKVRKRIRTNADIYYGSVSLIGVGPQILKFNPTFFRLVYMGNVICHQSIFAKRKLLLKYPFDLTYSICADRDWMIKCVKSHAIVKNIQPLIVANYDTNGFSSRYDVFFMELLKMAKKHGGVIAVIILKMKKIARDCLRKA